ncbi:MAG: hypothetical protein ACR2N3_08245 [Pyrinomonadaceae bacterium]
MSVASIRAVDQAVIKGVGLVNCLYYNPELDRFLVLDYRVLDPDM